MNYVVLLVIVLAASLGQLFLKLSVMGATKNATQTGSQFMALLMNWHFWAGVGLYGFTSLAWLWALKSLPLSRAYPFLALTFVLVPIIARVFLNEKVASADYFGMLLIVCGVAVIGSRM